MVEQPQLSPPPPPTNNSLVASAADEPEPLERVVAAILGPGSRVAGACRVPIVLPMMELHE